VRGRGFFSNISKMAFLKVFTGGGGHEKRRWYERPIQ